MTLVYMCVCVCVYTFLSILTQDTKSVQESTIELPTSNLYMMKA